MNLKDRIRLELDENQMTNSNDTVEKWKKLLEETTQKLKEEKVAYATLKRQNQKLQGKIVKLEEEKVKLQEELDELEEDNWSWRKNQDYMNGLLEREKASSSFLCHRIRELEEEIKVLKYRPLWKKLWDDIKPNPKYSYGYSRWYKWQKFFGKVFWVMFAVVFAMVVFVGDYYLLKFAKIWSRLY